MKGSDLKYFLIGVFVVASGLSVLALDGGGNPVLAFDELDPPGDQPWNVYVKRYNP